MGFRKGQKSGDKWCVGRHRSMPAKEADRCERAIETRERQAAKAEIEEQLLDSVLDGANQEDQE
tara:strand:- start:1529 stop:1720 length:192 start_codon:yes stop_codon:yes gene_type:complete